jgi:hypothetical protein
MAIVHIRRTEHQRSDKKPTRLAGGDKPLFFAAVKFGDKRPVAAREERGCFTKHAHPAALPPPRRNCLKIRHSKAGWATAVGRPKARLPH